MSCGDDVAAPSDFKSQDLTWQVGERAVFRRTIIDDGVEKEYTDDTMIVVGRNTVNRNVEITWDSIVVWRVVSNGEFQVMLDKNVWVRGMMPAPPGRWPNFKDTFYLTSAEGAVIGKYLEVMTTTSPDTTIQTPAGPFRCAMFEMSVETLEGKRVFDFGLTHLFYAPGFGIVRHSDFLSYSSSDKLYHNENRTELIKIIR